MCLDIDKQSPSQVRAIENYIKQNAFVHDKKQTDVRFFKPIMLFEFENPDNGISAIIISISGTHNLNTF